MAHVQDAPWEYDIAPFAVTDNVWYVGNAQVASHLIDTGAGLILLDTTWPSTLYLLLDSIRQAGFDPADIRYILHSHGHLDHVGGTRRLQKKYKVETFLGRNDLPLLKERIDLSHSAEYGCQSYMDFRIDHALKDGDTVTLGNTAITVYEAPGHTPGALCFFFDSTVNGRTVRVGMHGGVGVNTLGTSYMEAHHVNWRADYLSSLERMQQQHVDVVLGNHPYQAHVLERLSSAAPGVNPFVDPAWWGEFLAERMTMYRALLADDPDAQ